MTKFSPRITQNANQRAVCSSQYPNRLRDGSLRRTLRVPWKKTFRRGTSPDREQDRTMEVRKHCDKSADSGRVQSTERREHSSEGSGSGGGERRGARFLAVEEGWLQLPRGEAGQTPGQEKVFPQSELMSRETPRRSRRRGRRRPTRRASEQLGQESSASPPPTTPAT